MIEQDAYLVVRTKPLHEYRAQRNVARQGAESYLPLCRNQMNGRKEVMFPGYLFVLYESGWTWLRNTYGVLSVVLSTGGLPALMPSHEIEGLREREDDSGFIPLQPLFEVGDPVRVTEGAFAGCVGLYQGQASSRVAVLIEFLGRKVRTNVPQRLVEKVA